MSQSKILITGSTGTVGKELLNSLNERSAQLSLALTVRLLVRNETKAKELFKKFTNLNIEYVAGDLDAITSLDGTKLFEGIERVFVLTLSRPDEAALEKALIEQAITHATNLKQVVRLSALGASADADTNNLVRFHSEAENALLKLLLKKAPKVSLVILRPNLFMQNFVRDEIASIKATGVFYRPKQDHGAPYYISHVDVRDIGDLAAQVLTEQVEKHAGQTYNLTGPESLTYEEVAQIFSTSIGKPVTFVGIPEFEFGQALQQILPPAYVLPLLKLYQTYKLNGTTANVHGDYQLVTGKKPRSIGDFFAENKHLFN